ncbi:uncharacterized protein LOC122059494 isoform X4 [Macadamia integrifolia]|uniref:uncharacterized protein LOC122059494 isoform X4 n=1 Tax=Macadamia integrifolia TaxID=60698 RepID=UPI001C5310F1|nr:uncharacterized protein LOC122059494 isoform X4 [Macadamia integrifolia]
MANVESAELQTIKMFLLRGRLGTHYYWTGSIDAFEIEIDSTDDDCRFWTGKELSMYESSTTTVIQDKSELDLYLEEPRIKDPIKHYDVLAFWKSQGSKYRDLSRMARDVLTIPVSTVASESAFSARGRVIDKYRSKLLPTNAEALICLRDWMFGVDFRAEPVDDASDLANALGNVLSLDVSGDTNITVEPTQRSSNASTAANV